MDAPYRRTVVSDVLQASSRDGAVKLEVAPQHVSLELEGKLALSVTEEFVTIAQLDRRKVRKRSYRIGEGQLLLARAHQTEDIALWLEERPGIFTRLTGVAPVKLIDAEALRAWRDIDRIAARFRVAITRHARGATFATEYGRGHHRVLIVDYSDRAVVYARPIFRERPQRVCEVHRDGKIVMVSRRGVESHTRCVSRFAVTQSGDRILFAPPRFGDPTKLYLPWISPPDRAEITRLFRLLVDQPGELGNPIAAP